ncbi:serine hydrolase [Streptomyces sp. IBSBF 2390]|uniref:serine hydrolase n=1 Tax=Streptomyces sp. IBSBF 2390 TaxID=2903533 RepID=UPI002FDBA697
MTSSEHPGPTPRRRLLTAGLAFTATTALAASAPPAATAPGTGSPGAEAELRDLEQRYDARLGVLARNVRTGRTLSHRAGERFAMCSTFKAFAAAAVLRDHGDRAGRARELYRESTQALSRAAASAGRSDTTAALVFLLALVTAVEASRRWHEAQEHRVQEHQGFERWAIYDCAGRRSLAGDADGLNAWIHDTERS